MLWINKWEKELAAVQKKLFEDEKYVLLHDFVYSKTEDIEKYKEKRESLRLKIRNLELEETKRQLEDEAKVLCSSHQTLQFDFTRLRDEAAKLKQEEIKIIKKYKNLEKLNQSLEETIRRNSKQAYLVISILAVSCLFLILFAFIFRRRSTDTSYPPSSNQISSRFEGENEQEKLEFSITSSSKSSYFKSFDLDRICNQSSAVIEYSNLSLDRNIFTIGKMYFPVVDCSDMTKDIDGFFRDKSSNLNTNEAWQCSGKVSFNQEKRMLYWTMRSENPNCSNDARTDDLKLVN